ncbi:MAG: hypothetical protein QXS54_11955 [Candidatus Methanomethylicaceae archaeon]
MSLSIKCTGCGNVLSVPDELAGRRVRCKACQTIVQIPVPAGARPAVPPALIVLGDLEEDSECVDEGGFDQVPSSRKSRLLLVASIGGAALLLLIGGGVWFALSRRSGADTNHANTETPQGRRTLLLQQGEKFPSASFEEQRRFLSDLNFEKPSLSSQELNSLLAKILPQLRDAHLRPLILRVLEHYVENQGDSIEDKNWSIIADCNISTWPVHDKRQLLEIATNVHLSANVPSRTRLVKQLEEDRELASKTQPEPPSKNLPEAELEKALAALKDQPEPREAITHMAAALHAAQFSKPNNVNPIINTVRPYLTSSNTDAAYVARVVLFELGTSEHALEMLAHCDIPEVNVDRIPGLAKAYLPPARAFQLKVMTEMKQLVRNPDVQAKVRQLAQTGGVTYERIASNLLALEDGLPQAVLDALYIDSPHLTPEKLRMFLEGYAESPSRVLGTSLQVFRRHKSQEIRKTILTWLTNVKPEGSERNRFEFDLRINLESMVKEPELAADVLPFYLSVTKDDRILRDLAKNTDARLRHVALEYFAHDTKIGIAHIVEHLTIPEDHEKAKEILKAMFDKHGAAIIEPQIAQFLQIASFKSPVAAVALLEVLRDKGTKNSLPLISALAKHRLPQIAKAASEARQAIQKRGQ